MTGLDCKSWLPSPRSARSSTTMCAGLLASPFNKSSKLFRYVTAARPWKGPTDRQFPWPCFRSRFQARFSRPVLAYSAPSLVRFSGPDSGPVFRTGIRSALTEFNYKPSANGPNFGTGFRSQKRDRFFPLPAFLGLDFGVGMRPLKWNPESERKC